MSDLKKSTENSMSKTWIQKASRRMKQKVRPDYAKHWSQVKTGTKKIARKRS